MKFNLEEVYQEYLGLPYDEKVDNAVFSIGEIASVLTKLNFDEYERLNFYLKLTALFVAADKEIGQDEIKLFNDIFETNFDVDTVKDLFAGADDPEFVKMMDSIIDKFPDDVKFSACVYGLIFLSIDGIVTPKEKAVFERILA